ncbi:MAG: hypothetical protein H0U83_05805 [Sphingomonas sp.]|nr:hypothetical protein [Sphingomonas sp.]
MAKLLNGLPEASDVKTSIRAAFAEQMVKRLPSNMSELHEDWIAVAGSPATCCGASQPANNRSGSKVRRIGAC